MSRPFILIGDKTSHGGVVIEGASASDCGGIPIARMGDKVSCPIPGHGANVMAEGDTTCLIDGKPAARMGDKTACGAVLIATQAVSTD